MENYEPKTTKQIREEINKIKEFVNHGFYHFRNSVEKIGDEFAKEKEVFAEETIAGFYEAIDLFTALRKNAVARVKNRETPNFQIDEKAVFQILKGFETERDFNINNKPRCAISFREARRYDEFKRLFTTYCQIAGLSNRFAQEKADLANAVISECYDTVFCLSRAREDARKVLKDLEEDRKANLPYPFNNLEESLNHPEPIK